MPYGHMPTDDGKACGPADSDGYVRERIQTNGPLRVGERARGHLRPVAYLGYVPAYASSASTEVERRKWAGLPAAHLTSLLWDALAVIGLGLLGLRFGGRMLGATLAFAWAAYPFTQYVSSSNSNDAIMPALLIWGLASSASPPARGLRRARGLDEVRGALLFPLWASYPDWRAPLLDKLLYLGGSCSATALSFWILLLEPDVAARGARVLGPHLRLAARSRPRPSRSGTGTSTPASRICISSRPA